LRDDRTSFPIWEVGSRDETPHTYDDYERLFLVAYRAAFSLPATSARIRPYLTRYLRQSVIAPWVREYAGRDLGDPVAEELANAPIDRLFDWRCIKRKLEVALPFCCVFCDPVRPDQAQLKA
jgi:hypothetical protein